MPLIRVSSCETHAPLKSQSASATKECHDSAAPDDLCDNASYRRANGLASPPSRSIHLRRSRLGGVLESSTDGKGARTACETSSTLIRRDWAGTEVGCCVLLVAIIRFMSEASDPCAGGFCLRPRRHEVAVRRLSARPVPTRPNHARRSTLAGPSLFLAAV